MSEEQYRTACEIYSFAANAFFGKAPAQVMYRVNYGSRGTEQLVLDWIWNTYIEPEDNKNV